MPRKIGYARVSTKNQNLDMQIDALQKEGCDLIFQEKISSLKLIRPQFDACMKELKVGDILVVYNIDRVGRSFTNLINIIDELHQRDIKFKSMNDPAFDLTTATGRLLLNVIASVKAYEIAINHERSSDGREAAILKGVKFGRPKLNINNPLILAVKQKALNENMPHWEIASMYNISTKTVQRYKKL